MFRLSHDSCYCACALVAQNAQDPDRWESAMQAFEKQDKQNPPEKGGIVFIGSSSIRRWDLKKSFPDLDLINRGFGGSVIADSIRYFDRIVTPLKPRTVVLYAGDNDIGRGMTAQEVFATTSASWRKSTRACRRRRSCSSPSNRAFGASRCC